MLVSCFTLIIPDNIDIIYNEFGDNLPRYYKIENSNYSEYLFCVDVNINIKNICYKYNYKINNLYIMDINEKEYNNLYKIKFNYMINEDPYELVQYYKQPQL
jgi:hypothetical protein